MSTKSHTQHKEIIERYCHVIGENTAIAKVLQGDSVQMECLNSHKCAENGGCKNAKFNNNGND